MINVCVTKTSDWNFVEVRSYNNLEECVNKLLSEEDYFNNSPELVVSKPDDCTPRIGKDCDYQVEIYNTWRE